MKVAGIALLVAALTGGALVEPTPPPTVAETADPAPSTVVQPSAAMTIDRISGPDRYSTAVAVSQQAFSTSAPIVFLASGVDYPDALSAAPLAAVAGGPLLLTAPTGLPAVVATELQRLNPARVIIVGAEVAVSARVAQQVVDLGFAPERVEGRDRYATARALVREFIDESSVAYVATGRNYPDALAAAAAAGAIGAPVLLVNGMGSNLDADSLALLDELSVTQVFVAGGPNVVSEGIASQLQTAVTSVERLSGRDRYLTALAINQHAFAVADRAFVATGVGFADALAGAVYAATEQAPLYSSPVACLPRESLDDITQRLQVSRLTLLGGPPALGPRVAAGESCTTEDDDRATSVAELTSALQARLRTLPGTYSVSVRQLDGLEASVSIRGSVMQEPVSVIKVFVAYAVLDRIDRGLLSFSTPTRSQVSVGDCMRVMIHASDNYCHWDLVALVGQQNINNQLWAEGYRGTVYEGVSGGGVYYAAKRSTTDDLALLLSRLHRGELLSSSSTSHFMTLLETQLWRSKLPSSVPAGIPVGNKTGSAWNANGWYHSDVGIISAPGGTYVVAVLGSRGATATGVRALGRVAYEHFNDPLGAAATFSDLNLVTRTAITSYRYGSTSTPVGTIPAGVRLESTESARTWYRVRYNGTLVYVQSSGLRNYYEYPRS